MAAARGRRERQPRRRSVVSESPWRTSSVPSVAKTITSLETAFMWWIVFPLAVIYFVVLFRIHRGKAVAAKVRHGY